MYSQSQSQGCWEQEQTPGAGLGDTSCSSQPWDGAGHGGGRPQIPDSSWDQAPLLLPGPACPEEVWLCPGWHGKSRARRALQGWWVTGHAGEGLKGLMQGRCCQAALWLCQHSKVSWHKTHGKGLSQQSTTNSRRVFLAFPKISQPFCSSCLSGLENTLIFNLKDILIIYFPF